MRLSYHFGDGHHHAEEAEQPGGAEHVDADAVRAKVLVQVGQLCEDEVVDQLHVFREAGRPTMDRRYIGR